MGEFIRFLCMKRRCPMLQQYQKKSLVRRQTILKSILIVEDDANVGSYLIEAIRQESPYHSLLVVNSERALEVVKHIKPDLFLLDYHLSSMNGIELYDRLHATEGLEAIPAIIMSASLPQELLDKEIKQRHLTALPSPHELHALLATLQELLA